MSHSASRASGTPSESELAALVEETPSAGPARRIGLLAAVATFGSLLFGYDTGVIAGALPYMYMPQEAGGLGLDEFDEGLVGATLAIGAAFGAILGGRLSDRYGRRHNILLLALVFMIGTLGCTFSPSIPILLLFRFVLGWAVGGASATVPVYLSESAPTGVRGRLVALDQFMIVFGQLLAYSMNAALARGHGGPAITTADGTAIDWDAASTMTGLAIASGNGAAWRWMLVLATIPAILLWIGMRLMPESGRWYAANLRYVEAVGSLKQIRDPERDDITGELREMIELHERIEDEGSWSLSRTVGVRWTRRLTLIGVGLACFDQLTGINTAMYYLPKILGAAGFSTTDAISLNVVTGAVATLGAAFGLWLVGRLERRHVGIYQESGVTFFLFSLALVFAFGITPYTLADGTISPDVPAFVPWLVLVLVSLFVFAKQSGTVNWVLVSEIFPSRIRGVAQGFAVGCGWLMNAVVSYVFPVMIEHLGAAWTYASFGAINVVALCFYLFIVPETKGSSLERLEEEFAARYGR